MAMKCTQCGTLLVPGSRSCPGCGLQFATAVPPDPAAPPPVAPQYGAPPQAPYNAPLPPYGQAPPPQAPYGQAPQYGQPPQYVQPPKKGFATGGPKNYKWVNWVWIGLLIVRALVYFGSTSSKTTPAPAPVSPPVTAPAAPAQPDSGQGTGTAGLPSSVVPNYTRVDSLCADFMKINGTLKPDDATWRAQMEGNAADLKSAADEGQTIDWPANLQDAQTDYRDGLAGISDAAGRWPAAVENKDQATAKDCADRFQSGAQLVLKGVRLAQSRASG